MFVYIEADNDLDRALAKDTGEMLTKVYPGYPWGVIVRGGVVQIKCYVATFLFRGSWCMAVKQDRLAHDAKRRHKEIARVAGEFLERAGLARAGYEDGSEFNVRRIEGADRRRGGDKLERR